MSMSTPVVDLSACVETGQERLALDSSANSATIPANTTHVLITASGGSARLSLDGDATATDWPLPENGMISFGVKSTSTISVYGTAGYAYLLYIGKD